MIVSSGWMRQREVVRAAGSRLPCHAKKRTGTSRKAISISVARRGRRLPVRRKNGHARPAPVVDVRAAAPRTSRSMSRGRRRPPRGSPAPPRHRCCRACTGRGPPSPGRIGCMASKSFAFSSRIASGVEGSGRLHRQQRQHLQDVVLDDVPQGPGLLVEGAAPLDADRLGDRDLDVVDGVAVPDPLEDGVAEAEDEDVLHRLLAEVVVDAEDLRLVEDVMQGALQLARGVQVTAERLLDDQPRALDQSLARSGLAMAGRRPTAGSPGRPAAPVRCSGASPRARPPASAGT